MKKKHIHFGKHQYDKSYRSVTQSFKLKPNEKALISRIITIQELTDKATGKQLECFVSNSTLSEDLGIPFKTLEELIREMKKKYDFFTSTSIPGKGKSRNGGNLNRTIKRIDMVKLVAFLDAEQAEREKLWEGKEALEAAAIEPQVVPVQTEGLTFQNQAPAVNAEGQLVYSDNVLVEDPALPADDMVLVDELFTRAINMTNAETTAAKKNIMLDSLKHRARKEGFIISDRYERLRDYVESYEMTSRIIKASKQ